MVSGALIGNFVITLALLFYTQSGSLTLSVDSTDFSFYLFFILSVCLHSFFLSFVFVFLEGSYRIVIVSLVVITDCSPLVNFLRICVITPCYVIIFVMFCHLLYCKLT